jgi:hypothetical protein
MINPFSLNNLEYCIVRFHILCDVVKKTRRVRLMSSQPHLEKMQVIDNPNKDQSVWVFVCMCIVYCSKNTTGRFKVDRCMVS